MDLKDPNCKLNPVFPCQLSFRLIRSYAEDIWGRKILCLNHGLEIRGSGLESHPVHKYPQQSLGLKNYIKPYLLQNRQYRAIFFQKSTFGFIEG